MKHLLRKVSHLITLYLSLLQQQDHGMHHWTPVDLFIPFHTPSIDWPGNTSGKHPSTDRPHSTSSSQHRYSDSQQSSSVYPSSGYFENQWSCSADHCDRPFYHYAKCPNMDRPSIISSPPGGYPSEQGGWLIMEWWLCGCEWLGCYWRSWIWWGFRWTRRVGGSILILSCFV